MEGEKCSEEPLHLTRCPARYSLEALVLSLQKFLKDQTLVAKEVSERFKLTQEAATKKVQQYWKAEE